MLKKLKIKKLISSLCLIGILMTYHYSVFAADESMLKPPIEIDSTEWTDLNEESIKITPYMVSTPISEENESNNTVGTADYLSLTSCRSGKISSSTDVDFYWFIPLTTDKYRFDLVNVPIGSGKDYELAIYDENQTLKGIATTTEEFETIIVNLTASSKYYVKIYGYNGTYSTTDNYYITVTKDECAVLGYKYPFRGVGAPKKITANYGYYPDGTLHYGLDISATIGNNLYSVGTGTVFSSGWVTTGGNYVAIKMDSSYSLSGETTIVTYVHMKSATPLSNNAAVTSSTIVGQSGNTGTPVDGGTYGAHLHLQINNNGKAFAQTLDGTNNPLRYFTSYKFTGLSEDLTEYNSDTVSNINTSTLSDSMYIIDEAFISLVGRDNFIEWVSYIEKIKSDWSIIDFFNHFNISNSTIENIINSDKNLSDIYDINELINYRIR